MLRTDGYRVYTWVKLFTFTDGHPPSPSSEPTRTGDLTLEVYCPGTRARLLPLLGQGRWFGLKALAFNSELWDWNSICRFFDMALDGQMPSASVALLHEVEELDLYATLSLEDLAKLLMHFPGLKAL